LAEELEIPLKVILRELEGLGSAIEKRVATRAGWFRKNHDGSETIEKNTKIIRQRS
jgi:hypothetical protein